MGLVRLHALLSCVVEARIANEGIGMNNEQIEQLGKRIEAGDPELFEEIELDITNIDSEKPESVRAQVFKHSQ